jgi:hypothetical protein
MKKQIFLPIFFVAFIAILSPSLPAQELRTSIALESGAIVKPNLISTSGRLDFTAGIAVGLHWQNFTLLASFHRWFQPSEGLQIEHEYLATENRNLTPRMNWRNSIRIPTTSGFWGNQSISASLLYDILKPENTPWTVSLGIGVCALERIDVGILIDSFENRISFPQISRPFAEIAPTGLGIVGYNLTDKLRVQGRFQAHGFQHFTSTLGLQVTL